MSSLYMVPSGDPLTIEGGTTGEIHKKYTRKDKIHNRKEGRRKRNGGEMEGGKIGWGDS